jgi:hypothetical protein
MNHDEIQLNLMAFHDKELSPGEAETVRLHVESCAACREILLRYERVVSVLLPQLPIVPSEEFVQRVMRQVPAASGLRFPWGIFNPWFTPVFATGALVMLFLIGFFIQGEQLSVETLLFSGGPTSQIVESSSVDIPPLERSLGLSGEEL